MLESRSIRINIPESVDMYNLPTSVLLEGQSFTVRNGGDFRTVIDCFKALEDPELTKTERILTSLIIFYEGIDSLEDFDKFPDVKTAYEEMVRFFNCGQDSIGAKSNYKLIDWDKDSVLICSAVNTVAQKEIRVEPYLHWWTFMGYYLAIGDCSLSSIVSIRHKRATGKKLEKHEQQFVRENPEYFWNTQTIEQQELDAEIRRIWNNGGKLDG